MATKRTGKLQIAGRYLAYNLKHSHPFPFLPVNINYWAGLPYVVDADINYAKHLLQDSHFNRKQLTKIIRYARAFLRDKSFDCPNFVYLNVIL